MITFQGTGISSGIGTGKLCFVVGNNVTAEVIHVSDCDSEVRRLDRAVEKATVELAQLCGKAGREVSNDVASLFEAHIMILQDPDFTDFIKDSIRSEHINAEAAVLKAADSFAHMFESMEDEYMRARGADVMDIAARVNDILTGKKKVLFPGTEPIIIAADDLAPSETVQLDKNRIAGFILRRGNANGHTAILSRTLGIPAIINAGERLDDIFDGKTAIIDGGTGYAAVDPDDTTREYLEKKQQEENSAAYIYDGLRGLADETADGHRVNIYSNISSPTGAETALSNDAKGIGLFRSEFIYLESKDYPDEEAQFEAYKTVVSKMDGRPVIIRTLDIGEDKKADYILTEDEENPALGIRGIRLCFSMPDVFKTQLRALYRASTYGNLSIMIPMITSLWEIKQSRAFCTEVMGELKREGIRFDENMKIGAMIETPAAVMMADEIAKESDFFSIGTNDLVQYTLAADRQGAQGIERYYDIHHPAVMKMIQMTIDSAHRNGIWVGICGETASDLSLAEEYIKMGVDELSVAPRYVLPLRKMLREIRFK